ncbi:MAG: AmmeMemoRadiSam system protein B [Candidatus Aenigmarchaeota archaeon]|nr:AmmeMemoRadiSam system protein B [Candidatus Aenigmarchaeota archaeon]
MAVKPERNPVVAGMFYDLDPGHLRAQVGELFSGFKPGKAFKIVVSPHAGYVYSGKTAAHAVSALERKGSYIILGPNHSGLGPEFSVMSSGTWKTPLGDCRIDAGIAGKLKSCGFLTEDTLAHSQEHSIEVQLPFLQHRFKDFSFVPVCIMNLGYSASFGRKCEELGKAVAGIVGTGGTGVVASSDFSHYLPIELADRKDGMAIDMIMKLDLRGFLRILEEEDASICGFGPISVAMAAARELGLKPQLINKSSSGDETGDYRSVVTYYAIGFG